MISNSWILILSLFATTSFAADDWLIATSNELLYNGGELLVDVVKPSNIKAWPNHLALSLSDQSTHEQVEIVSVGESDITDIRRTYKGVAKSMFVGNVRAKLANLGSNRLLLTASSMELTADKIFSSHQVPFEAANNLDEKKEEPKTEEASGTIVISGPKEEPTITANEPLYFIVGSSRDRSFDARFQLSFKYRPFDPEATVATFIPYASNLYFAYTQTSIWDLGSDSSPFKDTSYRPSVYYNWTESGKGLNPSRWKFGLEHESNGRNGDESRSLNMAFVQPFWSIDFSGGKKFTFMPKLYQYIEKSDNRDIHHYRGYVDWMARYGREDAVILTGLYRQGTDGYAQGQLDLSYPLSDKLFGRTGTFLQLQLLGGYAETLIDYNHQRDTQLRIGISLAR
jgi:phospholipase A1